MTEKILKNNQAVVAGEIISDFEFSHEVFGEGFYVAKLKVSRLSHSSDTIPLLISERLIDVSQSCVGRFMGQGDSFVPIISMKIIVIIWFSLCLSGNWNY